MTCKMLKEVYLTKDNLKRRIWGKQIVECEREAEFILHRTETLSQHVCGYHAKIEMNRSKKYGLGFRIEKLEGK
jgi:hypothetical protein